MRAVLLVGLALATAGAAGWWAWTAHRARQPHSVLLGPAVGPAHAPPPDSTAPAPDSVRQPPAPAPTEEGVVDRLPRGRGRSQGSMRRVHTRTGFGGGVEGHGAMRWLDGAQSVVFDVDAAHAVTLTASVERGRLRLYLRDNATGPERFRWAEAVPGAPLRLSGRLITGTRGYLFYAESVGGRAEGVRWAVLGGA